MVTRCTSWAYVAAVLLLTLVSTANAKYSGGTGEPNDPYQIATAADLIALGETPEDYDKHFILTADIDLDPNLPGRKVFDKAVIAPDTNDATGFFDGTAFAGVFDGTGHTISHLTIQGKSYAGLFGQLMPGAEVRNLSLLNVRVTGSESCTGSLAGLSAGKITACHSEGVVKGFISVGGLVGVNALALPHSGCIGCQTPCAPGTITECSSTCVVTGAWSVGGLVGSNPYQTSHIAQCYSTGVVTGDNGVGGLVGLNGGFLTQCYSKGAVTGIGAVGGLLGDNGAHEGEPDGYCGRVIMCYSKGSVVGVDNVGGLVGCYGDNEVMSSFWDTQTSGQAASSGGTGKTTAEMQSINTFLIWGTCNNEGIWTIDSGNDYPRLSWENQPGESIRMAKLSDVLLGNGTESEPFLVYTPHELNVIGLHPCDWDKHFKLMADIDLSGFDGKGGRPAFNIIGTRDNNAFTGVFDGNGHTISNLTIVGEGYLGLFGRTSSGAEVSNLGAVDVNVVGSGRYVGALVGINEATVTDCHCTGVIEGNDVVGGLVGWNCYGGMVLSSYSAAAVSGVNHVGGLVGENEGSATNCHSAGVVTGNNYVGGLVAYNNATVTQCYSTSGVSGQNHVGGLVGENSYAVVTRCYSTGVVDGNEWVGGLLGCNWYGNVTECYSTGAASGLSCVGGLAGRNVGLVTQCYSTGPISGIRDPMGGLVGTDTGWWGDKGLVSACFWDTQTSGQATSAGGTGKTTAEMQMESTFTDSGWDFVGETGNGPDDVWKIVDGYTYPLLSWQKYSGGAGEPNDPYRIATAADLIALGNEPNDYDKHFILTADIDLDPNLPGGRTFDKAVIAPDMDPFKSDFQGISFTGVLDGRGHAISHLTIAGKDYVGLLGILTFGGEVMNLGVVDVNIAGSGAVGGLVGENGSTVTRCYSTGAISGNECVGGLVGCSNGWGSVPPTARMTRCYSTGLVNGHSNVGGLVGAILGGWATECYSTAAVSGHSDVGGLVGAVENPLMTSIEASFWDAETSGQATSWYGTGKTTAEMQTTSTFLEAGWDFVGETVNGTEDIWWINEGKGYPRLWWEGPACMVFVSVPAGTFEMGDHDGVGYVYERPVHTVTLRGFQMSKHETTNAQYAAYLNAALAAGLIQIVDGVVYAASDTARTQPYCDTYNSDSYSQIEYDQGRFTVRTRESKDMSDHPMVMVSWYGAKAFCDYYGCRLPTEAQWEYAAQGGYRDPYYQYPWGTSTIDCNNANYNNCNPSTLKTRPFTSGVGYYGPQGAYGLCDMSGNVWEWCQDWFTSTYYSISPASEPTGPADGTYRVLRGGAWNYDAKACRVPRRYWYSPDSRNSSYGFRVCR